MQKELACPCSIWFDMGRGRDQRCNVHANQVELAFQHYDIGFFDLNTASTDGFAFPTLERQAGLELLFDKVFVEGFFVGNDTHAVRGGRTRRFSLQCGIVAILKYLHPVLLSWRLLKKLSLLN